ncbi:MAG TPA: type III PLP-dependent enzyme [Candidatus Atribacteria bacterium]|nr:type III PLP-dependent enzyme [Candidatus Atribacteria bacterium]
MERINQVWEKAIPVSEEEIISLVREFDTPLLVISKEKLLHNYRAFQEFFPGIEIFYAVKANPHPLVIRTLKEAGSSFDVASLQEIELVLSHGVPPERMIFANTIKRKKGLRYARETGVDLMTYDNEEELKKIALIYPEARLLVRIKTPSNGARANLSYKFGAEPDMAPELLFQAQRMGLKPIGISFHVGSPCLNVDNYLYSLQKVREIIEKVAGEIPISIIDIGGGFPLDIYGEGEEGSLEVFSRAIVPHLQQFLGEGYRVIAEPGRVIVGSAAFLVTKVIGKALRSGVRWYYLDDGIYGTFSAIPFDKATFSFFPLRESKEEFPAVLAGPTCDSLDVVAENVLLPPLELDDLIVVPDIGAYSWASATNFNGFERAQVVMI